MPTLATLRKMIKQQKIEYIDLKFCDLIGDWHHITIPAYSLKPELFKTGVGRFMILRPCRLYAILCRSRKISHRIRATRDG